MRRIHWHWTAGTHTPNDHDRRAYHLLIDGDGNWHKGVPGIELNSGGIKPSYAAHTLNGNTDAIGISLCGMGGAQESPFRAGNWPIRPAQIDALVEGLRQLGEVYSIPVTRKTMLLHAEVQPTLGIAQRAKWDWTMLPGPLTSIKGALAIGDWIRGRVSEAASSAAANLIPAGATGRVTASSLKARNGPNGAQVGSIPRDTLVTVQEAQAEWLLVETPAGHRVWVSADYVAIVDGPPVTNPTIPDPGRAAIAAIRVQADILEANL